MLGVMRTKGVDRSNVAKGNVARLTSGGRINGLVLRANANEGRGVEMYSAHGDGRICAWFPQVAGEEDGHVGGVDEEKEQEENAVFDAEQSRKKRKRDLIGDLVEGLTKRPVTFS